MDTGFKSFSPLLQWLIIAAISGFMALLGTFASFLIVGVTYGVDLQTMAGAINDASSLSPNTIKALEITQLITSLFLFFGTALIVSKLYGERFADFYLLRPIKPQTLIFAGLFVFIISGPAIESLMALNSSMGLSTGDNNDELIAKFMGDKTISGLLLNILVFALIPAMGEELLFRGLVQKYLINTLKIPWLGILIAALLFSAIHMEWDYFLPRWFMGIILGLLFYCSRSLWLSILAHFINNAAAAVAFFLYTNGSPLIKENPLDKVSDSSSLEIIASYVVLTGLMIWVYRQRHFIQNTLTKLSYPL